MRKWIGAGIGVVVVAGVGYLGAQVYASQRFESEVEALVARLDASPAWEVTREDIEEGWFHSSGRLEARYRIPLETGKPLRVELPYEAAHGLLETDFSGEAQIFSGEEMLFGDVLDSEAPATWHGRFLTRETRLDGVLELPAFSQTVTLPGSEFAGEVVPPREAQLDFDGMTLNIGQVDGELQFDGQAPSLQMSDDTSVIRLQGNTLSGRYRGNDEAFEQTVAMTAATMTVTPIGNPSVVFKDVRYAASATLDADQLVVHLSNQIGDTRVQDQSVFSGGAEVTLDRVDGDAYREFAAELESQVGAIQSAAEAEDDAAMREAVAPLRDPAMAMLAGSPRLSLDRLTLDSNMLGVKSHAEGVLTFQGEDLSQLDTDTLDETALAREVLSRLEGQFRLTGAPSMLMMYLGLPLTDDALQVKLSDGILRVNGQQVPLMTLLLPADD
ncbi:DUF945 family protein [Salinicola avicenniae]|uniref:DUF945 family protein n=1 Tax=Salinicola avicenniae TaxID=2916836 RepID=UPI002073CAED|nr:MULTISPECIES: DUF945 family protein [unclassified Salinicola]